MLTIACLESVTDPKLLISDTIDLWSLKWISEIFISEFFETKNQKIERYTFDLLILEVVVGVLLEG